MIFAARGASFGYGGDFNLIRNEGEKNSDNVNYTVMDLFNNFTGNHQHREVRRAGPKYTWTNKQLKPIMVNLDRFLISTDWEERFPSLHGMEPNESGFRPLTNHLRFRGAGGSPT
jgi:hypothetical protein